MDDNDLIVTNKEIVEYLKITYAVLKTTKSTIDLTRLKFVIDTLKKENRKTYAANHYRSKFKVEDIIGIMAKQKDGINISPEEDELIRNYKKEKSYFDMVTSTNHSALYSYLMENGHELALRDLIILYFCLTGQETKIKKKQDILREINSYISQNLYFDNMNDRFNKNIKK